MAGRWLRNTVDGTIYGWNEILAENPTTEEESRKPKVKLKTKEVVKPDNTPIELAEEVTRSVDKKSKR